LDYSKEDHEEFAHLYNKDGTLFIREEDFKYGLIAPAQISLSDLERVRASGY
jgi:hypothetical protein